MRYNQKLQKAIALIITCTRRIKRTKDMVTLAKNISYAKRRMGGLEAVSEAVGLSVQQLKDFLAVEDLCKDVKRLVADQAIDSVDVVKNIRKLPASKQRVLARHLVDGRIASKDVRVITTFAKKFQEKPISDVLRDYYKSRDIKTYIVQFPVPKEDLGKELEKRFERVVGKGEIVSFTVKGKRADLELSYRGQEKLREAAKKKRITLRRFVNNILVE